MTAIVGFVDKGKVTMGADSAGVGPDGALQLRKDPKVFIRDGFLIGVCGTWRTIQELHYAPLPSISSGLGKDRDEWMVTTFLPWVRATVPAEDLEQSEILVGFQGNLYHIYGDRQVAKEIAPYDACGSGAQIARGALYAIQTSELNYNTPQRKVRIALEAAARYNSGVHPPFTILEI